MTGVTQMDLEYRNRALWFILLSLVLHAIAMFVLSHEWNKNDALDSARATPLDVEIVALSKQEIDKLKGQIVETTLTKKAETAAKDAYLGEQTQVVGRQSRAQTTAPFHDGKTGGSKGQRQVEAQQKVELGSLGVKMNLRPMGHLGPGETASSTDHLDGVKHGAQTLLNTKEFAYFSFYQRVRRQLEQYWEPGLRGRLKNMFDRGRRLAADKEHSTHLTVVMNSEGTITRILVEGTSGFMDLDQAAIDAFNKAGPFPNPPHGMVEHDGTVKVEWEFVLKT